MLKIWAVTEWSDPCPITALIFMQKGIMKALSHLRVGVVAGLLAFGSSVAPTMAQNDEGDMSSLFAGEPIFRDGLKGFRSLDGQGFSLMRRGNETLFRFDDALEVFAVHGVGGIWGAIATGIFAITAIGGTAGAIDGNAGQVLTQTIAVIATIGIWWGHLFPPRRQRFN